MNSLSESAGSLPAPRTLDPKSAPSLRWGIISTGWIAEQFVSALAKFSSQRVVAVGSRDQTTARVFADRHGIAAAYGSYEELVADSGVDVVYIGTPHNYHLPAALLALAAGKHTVIEKPIGVDAAEGRQIAAAAMSAGVFCMEAYWTAFLPKYDVLRQVLSSGLIGKPLSVVADFGDRFPLTNRIVRPELAGGPLLDLATYLVSFALDVLGPVDLVAAQGDWMPTGVRGQVGALLTHADGGQSVLHTSITGATPTAAVIAGDVASIVIDGPFYQPGGFSVKFSDGRDDLRYSEEPIAHQALHFQAAEVARLIAAGETESPLRPLSASIAALEVLDRIAASCDAN